MILHISQKTPSGNNIQYICHTHTPRDIEYLIERELSDISFNIYCCTRGLLVVYKHLQELAATAAELHYHTHSPRDSDISATFFFIFSHSEQFFLFFLCVCGVVVGYYHDRRVDYRSSRVTLLWLWLPSIIEGVWGIHFLLRLSPCVHSTSLTYLFWRERERANRKAYLLLPTSRRLKRGKKKKK